jgi:hypothetical protein
MLGSFMAPHESTAAPMTDHRAGLPKRGLRIGGRLDDMPSCRRPHNPFTGV